MLFRHARFIDFNFPGLFNLITMLMYNLLRPRFAVNCGAVVSLAWFSIAGFCCNLQSVLKELMKAADGQARGQPSSAAQVLIMLA